MIVGNILRKILPSTMKDLLQGYSPFSFKQKFNNLNVIDSGIDKEGDPFVKLKNGKIFYGYLPSRLENIVYSLMIPNSVKKKLHKSAFRVVIDILLRYSITKKNPISHGKFYDLKKEGL